MNKQIIISASNIGIGYSETRHSKANRLYNDLSFNLYKGELVCLLGANGAGKSTLLRTISASQPLLYGDILFNGKKLRTYTEKELSKLLGLVLTDKTSIGGLLVKELVELGRYPYTGFFGQLKKEDKNIVEKAMTDVGVIHKASSYVAELSDGERQKAMIAKALAQECPVVLLDEPTAFLDIESRIEVMNLLHNLAIEQNKTILLSTHDIDMAFLLSDRLWLLSPQKGLICGITEDIVLSRTMDDFFEGEKVLFNIESGNFTPNRKFNKTVFLKANGYLHHWTKNLLEKHGFGITKNIDDAKYTLTIPSANSIMIIENGKNAKFNNFEQLSDFLRDKNRI